MTLFFSLFLGGILLELFLALTLIPFLELIWNPEPDRMQRIHRILLAVWIAMLKLCGLISAKPAGTKSYAGPCVMVCNHPGLFDVLFLIRAIPRMSILVKRSLVKRLPFGLIFKSAGYVLSPDLEKGSPLESLMEAVEKIKNGYKFLIFPEGSRSPKGKLRRFKSGAFTIARMANVPVQPILIKNIPPFMPKEDKWYFPPYKISRLEIEYWEPILPQEYGEDRKLSQILERRYRNALDLD